MEKILLQTLRILHRYLWSSWFQITAGSSEWMVTHSHIAETNLFSCHLQKRIIIPTQQEHNECLGTYKLYNCSHAADKTTIFMSLTSPIVVRTQMRNNDFHSIYQAYACSHAAEKTWFGNYKPYMHPSRPPAASVGGFWFICLALALPFRRGVSCRLLVALSRTTSREQCSGPWTVYSAPLNCVNSVYLITERIFGTRKYGESFGLLNCMKCTLFDYTHFMQHL